MNKYPYKASVFCARNEIRDPKVLEDARQLTEYLANNQITLVNGGSLDGLMGVMAKHMHDYGGQTYGIGLHQYEPEPHHYLHDWEAYDEHSDRQRRLLEMGDIYIALSGGIGTLHEIMDVHILQMLEETRHPLILIGETPANYQQILSFLSAQGLMRDLPSNLVFVKDASEAIAHIQSYFQELQGANYFSSHYYPAVAPEAIYQHIKQNQRPYYIMFEGLKMKVAPNVYPSNRFRSSKLLGKVVAQMSSGKTVADIACGHGTMGLVAAANAAKHVVQVDINPAAVQNARDNAQLLGFQDKIDIYEGDVLEPLSYRYRNYFDVIYFNPPFHRNADHKNDKLMYAFYSQGNEGGVLDKFLSNVPQYLAKDGKIILGFSNKDPESLAYLEELIERKGYTCKLIVLTNQDTAADNRIYSLQVKQATEQKSNNDQAPIKIAAAIAQSGLAKNDGQIMLDGIKLAVKELKQAGIQVELGVADDQSKAKEAVYGISTLLKKFQPQAIIGPTWSYVIDASIPLLEEEGLPYFTPASSTELLKYEAQGVLAGSATIASKENSLITWLKDKQIHKLVYLHRENRWFQKHQDLFNTIAAELNLQVKYIQLPQESQNQSLRNLTEELKDYQAQGIIVDNYEDIFFDLLQELKVANLHMPILCNLSISYDFHTELQNLNPKSPIYTIEQKVPAEFKERYYHEYQHKNYHRYAFNAYAGVHILTQAILETKGKNIKEHIVREMNPYVCGESFNYNSQGDLRGDKWIIESVVL